MLPKLDHLATWTLSSVALAVLAFIFDMLFTLSVTLFVVFFMGLAWITGAHKSGKQ